MSSREEFQGVCFESGNGKDYMGSYDAMLSPLRERIARSRYNICAACVWDKTNWRVFRCNAPISNDQKWIIEGTKVIEEFERKIDEMESERDRQAA